MIQGTVKSTRTMRGWRIFLSSVLASVLVFVTVASALAHGCVLSPGGVEHREALIASVLPIDTGRTNVQTVDQAVDILSYGGNSMASKLEKFVLTSLILLHSGTSDMQGPTFAALNEGIALLDSGSTDTARMEQIKNILDAYVNAKGDPLDPRKCA